MTDNRINIACNINNKAYEFKTFPMKRLLDLLREDAKLVGAKEGCGEGECGACSVFLNGLLVNSCLVPAIQVQGAAIETIEGVKKDPLFGEIEKAFIKLGGTQCGMCTPGMMMATLSLLRKNQSPNEEEIKKALSGNLCRCTGYAKIIEAVQGAVEGINKKEKK